MPKDFQADLEDADSRAVTEWVRRFIEHEESVKGVPPRMVSEACKTIMGDGNKVLDLQEVKGCYFGVLQEVRRLLDERICTVQDDLARLEQELLMLDEIIAICFEKMDVAGDGEVTSERFVACVCGEGEGDPSVIAVSPEDVEVLFKQMSKGKQVITQEKFKEEVRKAARDIQRCYRGMLGREDAAWHRLQRKKKLKAQQAAKAAMQQTTLASVPSSSQAQDS